MSEKRDIIVNEHYITSNIRAFYRRRILSPVLYLVILLAAWLVLPLSEHIRPRALAENEVLADDYDEDATYVRGIFRDLTFCGYTRELFGHTIGYYYYGIRGDQRYIILLTPSTCTEGEPNIITKADTAYQKLLSALAEDLGWTAEGIHAQMPVYYYSEPGFLSTLTEIIVIFYFGTMVYAAFLMLLYLFYIINPRLSRPCQDLALFGRPKLLYAQAEEELATLPQLATEDMFITEHFFILTSPYGNAIIPIDEIVWIYKHSTLHKFLWHTLRISYTLHITASKHFYVRCPKNLKSDIDGIIDYLSEANHDILVGFSEENRLAVQKKLGKPFHIEKLIALLRRKV